MLYKDAPATVTTSDATEGTFEALVSVFGNVDLAGDRVVKGAFADTLAAWADKGDPIPVVWSHQSFDPDMTIGQVLDAEERDDGLYVKGALDLDAPKAAQVHRLLAKRLVTQFSFAYDVVEQEEKDGANELRRVDLYEVGPTPLGANPATELLAVKQRASIAEWERATEKALDDVELRLLERVSLGLKAGRVLSAKNETKLRDAVASITDVLKSLGEPPPEPPKALDRVTAARSRLDAL